MNKLINIVLLLCSVTSVLYLLLTSVFANDEKEDQCYLGEGGKRLKYSHSECFACTMVCLAKDLGWVDKEENILLKPVQEFFYPEEKFPNSQKFLEDVGKECLDMVKEKFSEQDLCLRANVFGLCVQKNLTRICPGNEVCSGPEPKYSTIDMEVKKKCRICPAQCDFGRTNWLNENGLLDIEKVALTVPQTSVLPQLIQECHKKNPPKPTESENDYCKYIEGMSFCLFDDYYRVCNGTLWGYWDSVSYN